MVKVGLLFLEKNPLHQVFFKRLIWKTADLCRADIINMYMIFMYILFFNLEDILKILDLVYSDSPCMVNEGVYIYTSVYIPFLGDFFPSIRAGKWFGTTECPRLLDGTCNTWKCWGGGGLFFTPGKKYIYNWYLYIYILLVDLAVLLFLS